MPDPIAAVKRMTLTKWKLGLRVSLLYGLFSAFSGAAADLNWKQFLWVVAGAIAVRGAEYILKNPIENVDDTTTINKTDTQP